MRSSVGEFNRKRFGALLLALISAMVFGCGSRHLCECPALGADIAWIVQASPDGGAVNDVSVTVAGDPTLVMACQIDTYYDVTSCRWSSTVPTTAGSHSYALVVAAPGFQTASVPATITVNMGDASADCGCAGATLDPSIVTLQSTPDGGP
jgi:hypothetical protein